MTNTPMWEDPDESPALRQLLRAGRVEHCDYDVERGLARHLAQLQAGTPTPAWAKTKTIAATSAAQTTQTAIQKSAGWTGWTLLPWLLPPVISAAVVGAWLAMHPADPTVPSVASTAMGAAGLDVGASGVAPDANEPGPARVVPSAYPAAPAEALGGGAARASLEDESSEARDRRDRHGLAVRVPRTVAARATSASNARRARGAHATGTSEGTEPAQRGNVASGAAGGLPKPEAAVTTSASAELAPARASAKAEGRSSAQQPTPAAEETHAGGTQATQPARDPKGQDSAARQTVQPATDEVSGARLEREMRMLAVAQRVLLEDPTRSLRLCRQGESEFPSSMFSAERKQVALLALVQLGRVDEARREGIPFLRAYPNAPWSARLSAALATGHLAPR